MIQYNTNAFEELKMLLGIKSDKDFLEFIASFGIVISRQNFSGWKSRATIPIGSLMLICNTTHFPIAHFFCDSLTPSLSEPAIIDPTLWREIYFMPRMLINACRDRTTYKERFKDAGIGRRYSAFLADDIQTLKDMSVAKLLELVNNTHVYLGDIIIDENIPIPVSPDVSPTNSSIATRLYREEHDRNTSLLREHSEDHLYYSQLEAENQNLQKAIDNIAMANEQRNQEVKQINITIATLRQNILNYQRSCNEKDAEIASLKAKLKRREYYKKSKQ